MWGGVDLGWTIGGIKLTLGSTTKKASVDQWGTSVVNEFTLGRTVRVDVSLAEHSVAFVRTMLETNGSQLENAQPLVLHPVNLPDYDKSEDVTIPLAICPGAIDFSYKSADTQVYKVMFFGLVDPRTDLLMIYGGDADTRIYVNGDFLSFNYEPVLV